MSVLLQGHFEIRPHQTGRSWPVHRSALSVVICAQQAGTASATEIKILSLAKVRVKRIRTNPECGSQVACTLLPWILLNSVNIDIIDGISVTWSVSQTSAAFFGSDCTRRPHTRMDGGRGGCRSCFSARPGCRHDGLRRSLHLDIAQTAKGKP